MKPYLTPVPSFPFPFFQYGSADSLDMDVIISLPQSKMPLHQEDRKRYVKALTDEFALDWNATLAVFDQGIMTDTIYPKSWIDSLNNALYTTGHLHDQLFEIPVDRLVKRNFTLAIYKTARTVLSLLTRTKYRPVIKPIIKGIHPFHLKLNVLEQLNLAEFSGFNHKNAPDTDIWKIIAFYIGQNFLLITEKIEVYTKRNLVDNLPGLKPFVYRTTLKKKDKQYLNHLKNEWLNVVRGFGEYANQGQFLSCNGEVIDMKNEKF